MKTAARFLCLILFLWFLPLHAGELTPYTGIDELPSLVLEDLSGQRRDLGELRGNVLVYPTSYLVDQAGRPGTWRIAS